MAKPITTIRKQEMTEKEKRKKTIEELKALLSEKEPAVSEILNILQELHESGILEAIYAMLKAKEDIAKILIEQANRKPVTTLVNNLMELSGVLTKIDPGITTKFLQSTALGITEAYEQLQTNGKKITLFELLSILRDPDVNRAIRFIISLLKGIGKGLKEV
ncbi:helical membrane plugin domain-containing protein [Thermaerobacillus caldiproteolyticus]|uniref:Uncharacterized protein YjgD (DUF1641 family) n=1 Tax=Thermaerobacillus caldiproteolyticus TaxID=247480 RepID=A0A7V9Z9E5_9BACL|nr:DUF1641 domain-containing protein [Anoxybacillus caldiproteolyticus]MBA2876515.1 uncharacterized protein YjgD (DUF1641 family) [Anoxybacillus caldiproteolyticus]